MTTNPHLKAPLREAPKKKASTFHHQTFTTSESARVDVFHSEKKCWPIHTKGETHTSYKHQYQENIKVKDQ